MSSAAGGPELLFREDTCYTEITNEFVRTHATEYLKKALKGPLKKITERAMSEDFEIDAARVPKPEDQAANASRLIEAADLILESLVSRMERHLPPCVPPCARSKYPHRIRAVNDAIGLLVDSAVAKFGVSARNIACATIFFMRFVCPALVTPAKFEIIGKISSAPPDIEEAVQRSALTQIQRHR